MVLPEDFDGEKGAYPIDCQTCGADAHLIGWNRFRESPDDPQQCAYCGSTEGLITEVSSKQLVGLRILCEVPLGVLDCGHIDELVLSELDAADPVLVATRSSTPPAVTVQTPPPPWIPRHVACHIRTYSQSS